MTIEEYENLLASEKIVLISFKTDCTHLQTSGNLPEKKEKNRS
jgi:hypothetical protein